MNLPERHILCVSMGQSWKFQRAAGQLARYYVAPRMHTILFAHDIPKDSCHLMSSSTYSMLLFPRKHNLYSLSSEKVHLIDLKGAIDLQHKKVIFQR